MAAHRKAALRAGKGRQRRHGRRSAHQGISVGGDGDGDAAPGDSGISIAPTIISQAAVKASVPFHNAVRSVNLLLARPQVLPATLDD